MENDDLTQDQADEIAAALDLMSGQSDARAEAENSATLVDYSLNAEAIVRQACLALARDGTRPTLKAVVTYLLSEEGHSPTVEIIKPWVRRWRAEQWASEAVRMLFHRFLQLNAEQQAALRELIQQAESGLEPLEQADPIYEIHARLADGQVLIERATRKTLAWVRYYNVMERQRLHLLELDIIEIYRDGRRATLRQWRRG